MKTSNVTMTSATALLALVAACGQVHAAGSADIQEPLALRQIMQDLGRNMQLVTGGISREDWALVAKTALLIADHAQPPMSEKARILSYMGGNASSFRAHDARTQDAAQALAQAATRADGQGVVAAFATLQSSCLACHQVFRKPFVEHFYGQR
ncbi:MAG: cytochrome c [Pseudomonadota bacterium]